MNAENNMDRLKWKNELFMKLGALFGPLQRLVEKPDQYDEQERAQTIARYFAEYPILGQEFRQFSLGQQGHNYAIEYSRFYDALDSVRYMMIRGTPLENILQDRLLMAQTAIDAVPVPRNSLILEAGSPFSTFCKLKGLCEIDATDSLVWIDAYMAASIFHRYLATVRTSATITLVTCKLGANASRRDNDRWNEFLDISRLFAQERGNQTYRLIVHQGLLHDRWLVFDEKRMYGLGGSAKDAGDKQYFTISIVDASRDNLAKIQKHVDDGSEYFGPDVPQHL